MSNANNNACDVLAYNTCGCPLTMAAFTISKEDVEKNITALAATYIDGEFTVKIDTWVDDKNSEYDTESKQNRRAFQTSFQVWIPKSNTNIVQNVVGKDNVFVDGIPQYNEDFKKFVNMYGIQGDKDKPLNELGKKGKYIIVLLDPNKIFTLLFDARNVKYNENNPQNKCNKPVEVIISNLYDNENPIDVLTGKADRRRYRNLTGFIVKKYYASINNGNLERYRPAYQPRRKKYLD